MNIENLNSGIEKHLKDLTSKRINNSVGFEEIDLTDSSLQLRRLTIELKLSKGKIKSGILNNRNVLLF